MYSSAHAQAYEDWMGGVEGTEIPYDRCGESIMVKMPSQFDNIRFFLSYQCNFMYWRYFMWNFAGRQNDIQGNGEPEHGNWITGFSFIDDSLYGDQSKLPDDLKENKGHNVFYCMPLILFTLVGSASMFFDCSIYGSVLTVIVIPFRLPIRSTMWLPFRCTIHVPRRCPTSDSSRCAMQRQVTRCI